MNKFVPFRQLIKAKCGVMFKDEGLHILEAAIKKRCIARSHVTFEKYFEVVKYDEEELYRLIDLITINETYFLREKKHFEILCNSIIPELLHKVTGKIKILSAGCSTGEEAYSILISLIEKYGIGIRNSVEIYGIDIDRNVIKTAKDAVYGNNSIRNDEQILLKYFVKRPGKRYALSATIRDSVDFQVCNLLESSAQKNLKDMHVIFYRNVSIYFDRDIQRAIFNNLSNLLEPEGFIFLSSAETYHHNIGILTLKQFSGAYIYQKNNTKEPNIKAKPKAQHSLRVTKTVLRKQLENSASNAKSPEKIKPQLPVKAPETKRLLEQAFAEVKQGNNDKAIVLLDSLIVTAPTFLDAYVLKASILANLKKNERANTLCKHIIKSDEWNLDAHFLMGMVAMANENFDDALKMFKSVIYIRSNCWLAYFYLADVYHSQEDFSAARNAYKTVLKLLVNQRLEEHGLTYFPISFSQEQLVRICQQNIDTVGTQP